jgi:type III secretion system YscI/HrpB-like protein
MVDPVLQRATQQIAEQSVQQGASQGAGQSAPSAADQSKFDAAMNGGQAGGVQPTQAMDQVNAAQSAQVNAVSSSEPRSLGDAILNGLDQIRATHDMRMENIQEKLTSPDGGELTVQDAMALQFEVMQLGVEHDLTTKVADKTSQGVQTLFHNQ